MKPISSVIQTRQYSDCMAVLLTHFMTGFLASCFPLYKYKVALGTSDLNQGLSIRSARRLQFVIPTPPPSWNAFFYITEDSEVISSALQCITSHYISSLNATSWVSL